MSVTCYYVPSTVLVNMVGAVLKIFFFYMYMYFFFFLVDYNTFSDVKVD